VVRTGEYRCPAARAPQASSTRPHQFGFGGSISASNGGAAGDVRYWFGDHLGLNMSAVWHRSGYETRTGQRASTVHASPSIIYMFGKPNYTREVDIRPYAAGGASYVQSSTPVMSPSGAMLMSEASGTFAAPRSRSRKNGGDESF
jgi:opacity protein-like surface antigen